MSTIEIRPLRTPAEMTDAATVYQRAFGYRPGEATIPPKLLLTLGQHGGLVLGALRGTELVGFCYGFLARDTPEPDALYLFSQSMAVLPGAQNTGLGRRLKWAQRDWALANGIGTIRWTFDPMRTRNAHLNFDVLGARSGTLLADYFGTDSLGRDSGAPSDRLLVDWVLDPPAGPAPAQAPPLESGPVAGERVGQWLALPAEWDAYRAAVGAREAERVRLAVRDGLAEAFDRGERAVSCRRLGAELAAYRLV